LSVTSIQLRRILFTGQVQGVGFRYTTEQLARECEVTGYVRNRDDGRVELMVEGAPEEIDRLVGGLRSSFGVGIESIETQSQHASGSYQEFTIRH
jgi:acylphosphatase